MHQRKSILSPNKQGELGCKAQHIDPAAGVNTDSFLLILSRPLTNRFEEAQRTLGAFIDFIILDSIVMISVIASNAIQWRTRQS